MTANLPIEVGDLVDADLLNEISGIEASVSFLNTVGASPLVSSANTNALIVSGSYDFVSGYAYEISAQCRWTVTGSPTGSVEPRVMFNFTRVNASGTSIWAGGYLGAGESLAPMHFYGSQIVKVTGGDTTQTICLNGQYSTVGSASAMGITTNGATTPARLTIKRIGLASKHSTCLELPTS